MLDHFEPEDWVDEPLRLSVEVLQSHRKLLALASQLVERLKLIHLLHDLDLLLLIAADGLLRLGLLQELAKLLLEGIIRLERHASGLARHNTWKTQVLICGSVLCGLRAEMIFRGKPDPLRAVTDDPKSACRRECVSQKSQTHIHIHASAGSGLFGDVCDPSPVRQS